MRPPEQNGWNTDRSSLGPARDGDQRDAAQPRHHQTVDGAQQRYELVEATDRTRIQFLAPNRDVSAAPGGKVRMRIKATDKYGLGGIRLLAGLENRANRTPGKQ